MASGLPATASNTSMIPNAYIGSQLLQVRGSSCTTPLPAVTWAGLSQSAWHRWFIAASACTVSDSISMLHRQVLDQGN